MTQYILKKAEGLLENINTITELDLTHEVEFRFGTLSKNFNPKLTYDIFKKIHTRFSEDESIDAFTNEVIVDWIYNKNAKFTFLDKRQYNLHRSKFLKKITYDSSFSGLTTDFDFSSFNSEHNTNYNTIEYQIKEPKHRYTRDNIRLSYSLEKNINVEEYDDLNAIHPDFKPYDKIRLKNRYSTKLNRFIRLDMTIAKTISPLTYNEIGETEYIVELEIINKDDIPALLRLLKNNLKTIRRIYFNAYTYLTNLSTMNPATMERQDVPYLKKYKYTVTDKADGERLFLIFYDNLMMLKNPKTGAVVAEYDNPTSVSRAVIDGEYLHHTHRFLAFDILFYQVNRGYKDARDFKLDRRLRELEKLHRGTHKSIRQFSFEVKKFYTEDIFTKAKEIWDNREKLFKYELDGLIFTPIDQPYTSDKQDIPVLKWKEKLSIDVRVDYNQNENFTYFHHGTMMEGVSMWKWKPNNQLKNNKNYTGYLDPQVQHARFTSTNKDIIRAVNDLNLGIIKRNKFYLGKVGPPASDSNIRKIHTKFDIVEYEFDFIKNEWIALRIRTFDKEKANAKRTIESVLKSIINYISIDDIYELQHQNEENVGALYNLTKDTIKRKQWRNYNGFVKGELYKQVANLTDRKRHFHLELACGKLGDLKKFIKYGYTDILAMDTSDTELYGANGAEERMLGMGFRKVGSQYRKGDLTITLVWGDVTKNIKSGEAGMDIKEKKKIADFFDTAPEDWEGFNSCSIMYAIHYFFGYEQKNEIWDASKEKFDGFMENLSELMRYDGIVFGTYLNNISKEDMSFVQHGDVMYQIKHLYQKAVPKNITYDTFFKKKQINTIAIKNEVWGPNVEISEPRINKSILTNVFEHFGFKSIQQNTSFEQYYQSYVKERKMEMPNEEKRLSFINNTFMFSYIDIDQQILKVNDLLDINIYNKTKLIEYLLENIRDGDLDDHIVNLYDILIK